MKSMNLIMKFLKLSFQRLHFILIGMLVFALTTAVSIYLINPYDIQSNNIRPRVFGMDIYRIPSKSMQPLLNPGDIIVVSNKTYLENPISRNEIVVFNRVLNETSNKSIPFIKRVIAKSDDQVKIDMNIVYVNGTPILEPYVLDSNNVKPYSTKMSEFIIPKGKLFVLGDNRDNSNDSRMFGLIAIEDVVGKATNILYSTNGKSGNKIK